MNAILFIIATGFLVRADGWGPQDGWVFATWPEWKRRASKFFNVWSCSALFVVLSAFLFPPLVALACGVAFALYRFPGFNPWQVWRYMFLRGLWPTAIGFAIVAAVSGASLWFALLCVPFAVIYASIYSGGYRYLPQTILGLDRHVWIEHASAWAFAPFIILINS
jgi:predicted lysophospholipase L1 biosynthesis ABC-type transport system permease subunit